MRVSWNLFQRFNRIPTSAEAVEEDGPSSSVNGSGPRVLQEHSTLILPKARSKLMPSQSRLLGVVSSDSIGGIEVCRVATDPTNTYVAKGSTDGKVALIKPIGQTDPKDDGDESSHDEEVASTFQGPEDYVSALCFSKDGSMLLAAWLDGTIIIFRTEDGSQVKQCQAPNRLFCCALSDDSKQIAIGGYSVGRYMTSIRCQQSLKPMN